MGFGIEVGSHAGGSNWIIKNNLIVNAGGLICPSADTFTIDNNSYYNWVPFNYLASTSAYGGISTLAAWQTALGGCPSTGRECNSITANPNLNSNYTEQASSPTVGAGANLTTVKLTALDYGKSVNIGNGYSGTPYGNARPSTGAWDIGAYQYNRPPSPTNLRIIQ